MEFIQASHLSGPMLNDYNFGGYLIWAAPEHPVFIDGRTDVYEWSGVLGDGESPGERPNVFQFTTLERLSEPTQTTTENDSFASNIAKVQAFRRRVLTFLNGGVDREFRVN